MSRRFRNLDPSHRPHRPLDILRWGLVDPLLGRRRVAAPGPPAPSVSPDLDLMQRESVPVRATWIGHASFLVSLGRRSVLIDPVFSDRVFQLFRRHGLPGLLPGQLPAVSAVLITHNHYDHLDRASLQAIDRDVPAVVPTGLGRWFRRWNTRPVVELGWWQSTEVEDLEISLVPSRHWSRRFLADTNKTLWGGFVVRSDEGSVYHAGDSAWFEGFREIGRRFPGLEAALLPIGGYGPPWFMEKQHMNPEQAGQAFLELGAEWMVPMHWGAFQLTDEPISEPAGRMERWWNREGPRDHRSLAMLAVGGTLALDQGGRR